jgi:hypothetical protein
LRHAESEDARQKIPPESAASRGGNSIGQNASQRVLATLICEAAAPFVELNTTATGVPLEPNGDFRINDTRASTAGMSKPGAADSQCWQSGVVRAGIPSLGRDEN